MNSLRKASWFPWLSVLLLAVWIPMQAAGCCKLAVVLGLDLASRTGEDGKAAADASASEVPAEGKAPATGAAAGKDLSGALALNMAPGSVMAGDHSCCRKPSNPSSSTQAAPVPQAGQDSQASSHDGGAQPCEGGDKGCCIQGAGHILPGLASTPVSSYFQAAALLAAIQGETLPVTTPLLASAPPEDAGPPLYLVHLRLLI